MANIEARGCGLCGDDLRIEGEDKISRFDSTPWAERAFCSVCGTHRFIRVKSNGRYIVAAGLFPVERELRFDHQIFIDQKPGFYSFAEATKKLTGAEAFAGHAPGSD